MNMDDGRTAALMMAYAIYQLKSTPETLPIYFMPIENVHAAGRSVDRHNYAQVYGGVVSTQNQTEAEVLEALFAKFNLNRPADFHGHSLSISDVVVLRRKGVATAHYVDFLGFVVVPEFFADGQGEGDG